MADVFVIPSRQDNLPNTVLESLSCGTPVLGFDIGGIPDMVRPGETGWLASDVTSACLQAKLHQCLNIESGHQKLSSRCRKVAEEEYDLSVQARRYQRLYRRILVAEKV
jgi:glycosyltransferase involved in cell wall biosynthesis